jgi:hypothetical protein
MEIGQDILMDLHDFKLPDGLTTEYEITIYEAPHKSL